MIRKTFFTLTLLLTGYLGIAQEATSTVKDFIDTLNVLGKHMIEAPTEDQRREYQETFDGLLYEALLSDDAMTADFSAIRNVSSITSPDNNFRIFTYLMPLKGGRNHFYGFLLQETGKRIFEVITLEDNAYLLEEPEYKQVEADSWYGAIYYDIIKVKQGKSVYYTLLGFHPDLSNVHQKVVDVLWFEGDEPQFGASIFMIENFNDRRYYKAPQRLIMKYKNEVTASIRHEEKNKRILIDHVSPPDAALKGFYDNYGPDFTYDALIWRKKGWELETDVSITSDIITPPNNPKPKQKRN
ncbi:MAG: hypothetical protein LAT76_09485 [Schleiferiaceae bacterium]|nr:hypothetical protein [Schleiferiaceae bacterium]